jgi:tetratricopeptide (TPR) repeat protein
VTLIKASNDIESGKFNEAYNMLMQQFPKLNSDRLKGESLQYLSDVCFELGKINESLEYAGRAIKLNIKDEKWVKPFSYYFAARASYKNGNKSMASKYLDEAEDFSDYDYQNKLSGYIKALKMKL